MLSNTAYTQQEATTLDKLINMRDDAMKKGNLNAAAFANLEIESLNDYDPESYDNLIGCTVCECVYHPHEIDENNHCVDCAALLKKKDNLNYYG